MPEAHITYLGVLFAEEKNYVEAKKHYLEALNV
jgi:hypothetical protein